MPKKFYSSVGKRVKALERHEEMSHGESMSEINKEYSGSLRGNASQDLETFPNRGGMPLPSEVIHKTYPQNPTGSFPEINDGLSGIDMQNREDAAKVKHEKNPRKF